MASRACDRHGSPQPGRLCGFYPTLVTDSVRRSKRMYLCTGCARELVVAHATDWLDTALESSLRGTSSCTSCGQVVNGNGHLSRFYATLYLDGKSRRDYAAAYCPDCTRARSAEFGLDV